MFSENLNWTTSNNLSQQGGILLPPSGWLSGDTRVTAIGVGRPESSLHEMSVSRSHPVQVNGKDKPRLRPIVRIDVVFPYPLHSEQIYLWLSFRRPTSTLISGIEIKIGSMRNKKDETSEVPEFKNCSKYIHSNSWYLDSFMWELWKRKVNKDNFFIAHLFNIYDDSNDWSYK